MARKKTTRKASRTTSPGAAATASAKLVVDRVQTGVRMEKRILKVLKGLAEYLDISLGDLLEAIVLHAFDGKAPFTNRDTLLTIAALKQVYKLDLDHHAGHHMIEKTDA